MILPTNAYFARRVVETGDSWTQSQAAASRSDVRLSATRGMSEIARRMIVGNARRGDSVCSWCPVQRADRERLAAAGGEVRDAVDAGVRHVTALRGAGAGGMTEEDALAGVGDDGVGAARADAPCSVQ